jgi:hypothetical protein
MLNKLLKKVDDAIIAWLNISDMSYEAVKEMERQLEESEKAGDKANVQRLLKVLNEMVNVLQTPVFTINIGGKPTFEIPTEEANQKAKDLEEQIEKLQRKFNGEDFA